MYHYLEENEKAIVIQRMYRKKKENQNTEPNKAIADVQKSKETKKEKDEEEQRRKEENEKATLIQRKFRMKKKAQQK